MTFPISPFLPLADLHSSFQLRLIFTLLSPNIFSPCEQLYFPFCILSLVLFSCLHFPGLFCPITYHFFKYIYDAVLRVASSMWSYLQHRHTCGHRWQHLSAAWWQPGKDATPKVWRKPAHYKIFWATALPLFIANSRLFLMLFYSSEPCLGHDLLLNFQQYVNIVGPTVRTPTEVAMPSVAMCHADASGTRVSLCCCWVPMNPIAQPCEPGMTFTLTSSAPHGNKALTLQSSLELN